MVARAIQANLLPPVKGEDKSLAQRQADALGDLCEQALDDGRLPDEGGQKPHVSIILDWAELQRQARGVMLDYGGYLQPAEVRRFLCDCGVTPVVLGGEGQPLDVGRERRTATLAQRKALAGRDRGCSYPGCDRPPSRCQAHHVRFWTEGGVTNVDDMVLLCRSHHRMVHNAEWLVRIHHGRPEFVPPKWVDPTQTPRRAP